MRYFNTGKDLAQLMREGLPCAWQGLPAGMASTDVAAAMINEEILVPPLSRSGREQQLPLLTASADDNTVAAGLICVSANRRLSGVVVKWKAVNIEKEDEFVVFRSNDGESFAGITGFSLALLEAGHSDFAIIDAFAPEQTCYYRVAHRRPGRPPVFSKMAEVAATVKPAPLTFSAVPSIAENFILVSVVSAVAQKVIFSTHTAYGQLLQEESVHAEAGVTETSLYLPSLTEDTVVVRCAYHFRGVNEFVTRQVCFDHAKGNK